jgi:hypothetical protein
MTPLLSSLRAETSRAHRAGTFMGVFNAKRLDSTTIATLLVICAVSGVALALWPFASLCALAFGIALALLLQMPRPAIVLVMAFIIIQDPLRLVFRGDETTIGFVVKRLDEAVVYALSAWVLVSSRLVHRALRAHGLGLVILACYAAIGISTVLAHAQLAPALLDLALFSKPFLLFAIGTSIVLEQPEFERGLRPALIMMLGVILFAVVFMAFPALQDAYIGDVRGPDVRVGLVSAQGFFDGPGPYSWFCAATFAIAYAAYLSFSRKFYLYAACISGLFTLIAWRRKSIIGVVAMLVLATILQGRFTARGRLRAFAIVSVVALMAATVLAPYLAALWSYTVTEYATDPYSTARFALHRTSMLIAMDHFPFGTGLASFASHASRLYYSDVYFQYGLATIWGLSPQYPEYITDTFWPMVLGEGGIATLVAYAGFFLLLATQFWRAAKRIELSREHRFLLLAASFLLVGSLSESTSSQVYNSTMQSALAMIPIGMCWRTVAVQQDAANRHESDRPTGN